VEQLAFRRLRLGFEQRTPIPESLERDPLRLAILPLVQVAALPRLMMRPPEVRSLTRPSPMLVRHIVLSIFKIEDENRSGSLAAEQLCEKWTLTSNSLLFRAASLFRRENSLFRGKNSLFDSAGNSLANR
jgi:hypothetical protein